MRLPSKGRWTEKRARARREREGAEEGVKKIKECEGFQLCSFPAFLTKKNQIETLPLVQSYLGLGPTLAGEGSGKR